MSKKQVLWSLVILLLTISGCSKSKDEPGADVQNPALDLSLPAEDFVYLVGSQVVFSGVVTDNRALASLKVTLGWHGETKSSVRNLSIYEPWETQTETILLKGKTKTFDQEPLFTSTIPTDIQVGYYKMVFELVDVANNQVVLERMVRIF